MFQDATLLEFPVAVALACAFVVLFLAFRERDFALHFVRFPVQRRRDTRVAFLTRLGEQARDFFFVQ